nr:hypothetical protein [Tanacetum cinerariifolium]
MDTIHVTFDELTAMASELFSSRPGIQLMTLGTSSSGLVPNPVPQQPFNPPTRNDCVEEPIPTDPFDDPCHEPLHVISTSQESSSNEQSSQSPLEMIGNWTKHHPLANVISNPSRLVSTRKQLQTDAMWCYFDAFLTSVEPKNFK